MPMRSELGAYPVRSSEPASAADAWAIVSFCLLGLLISLYLTTGPLAPEDVPSLIVQNDLG
jgi:hypothetical protein